MQIMRGRKGIRKEGRVSFPDSGGPFSRALFGGRLESFPSLSILHGRERLSSSCEWGIFFLGKRSLSSSPLTRGDWRSLFGIRGLVSLPILGGTHVPPCSTLFHSSMDLGSALLFPRSLHRAASLEWNAELRGERRASFGSLGAISVELSVCLARLRIILGRVYGGYFARRRSN